jgi:exopolysaccharide production protein ExoZ
VDKKPIQNMTLEALRGIAALAVFFSHADHHALVLIDDFGITTSSIKGGVGHFGVCLFFILSGYLIWSSALKTLPREGGLAVYTLHRVTRILPLFYINVFAAAYLIPALGSHFTPTVTLENLWRHLTFTQDLAPSVSRTINPVLWSLTHEMLFYVLVPVLFVIRKANLSWLIILAVIFSLPAGRQFTGPFVAFFHVFYLFVIGIVAAEWVKSPLPRWIMVFSAVIFAASVKFGVLTTAIGISAGAAMAVFLCALSLQNRADTILGKMMSIVLWPFAVVGVISYSLYIWHYLFLHILSFYAKPLAIWLDSMGMMQLWSNGLYRGIGVVLASLLVAAMSYFLIERPSMGQLRRFILRRASYRATTPITQTAISSVGQ